MLRGVDVPPALVVALEVQAVGRDDAEQALQGGEGDGGLRDTGEAGALAALNVFLVCRGQAVAARGDWLTEPGGVGRKLEDRWIAIGAADATGKSGSGNTPAERKRLAQERTPLFRRRPDLAGALHLRHQAARFFGTGKRRSNSRRSGFFSSMLPAIRLQTVRQISTIVGSATL